LSALPVAKLEKLLQQAIAFLILPEQLYAWAARRSFIASLSNTAPNETQAHQQNIHGTILSRVLLTGLNKHS
jgi:hypothetical protein